MNEFQFGDKVMVQTFNNAGKMGLYPFTVKANFLVMGGRRYDEFVVVFSNEHLSVKPDHQLFFPKKCCSRA